MFHFYFSSVHSPSHSFHLQIVYLIHIYHIWLQSYYIEIQPFITSFTFQPIQSLEINDLPVFLDKVLILDRYSLLEIKLWWF